MVYALQYKIFPAKDGEKVKLYRKINVTEGHKRKEGDARVRGPIYKQTKHLQRNFFLLLKRCSFAHCIFLTWLLCKISSRDEQNLFAKKRVTSLCRCHKFSLAYNCTCLRLSASTTRVFKPNLRSEYNYSSHLLITPNVSLFVSQQQGRVA